MKDINTSILIVEDDESVRRSYADVFSYLGYGTRTAPDGLAALIEIREKVPDILLSDLNMPAMSGFELLSVVRRRFPSVYLIAMVRHVHRQSVSRRSGSRLLLSQRQRR